MEILNSIFTLQKALLAGGIVFSLFLIILTIQMYVNTKEISDAINTKRNFHFQFISLIFIVISVLFFVLSFIFL